MMGFHSLMNGCPVCCGYEHGDCTTIRPFHWAAAMRKVILASSAMNSRFLRNRISMIDAAHPKTAARWLPYAALALGLCVFATGAVFVRMAQAEQIPSLAIAVLRYFFAVMILSPQLLTRHGAEIRRLAARDFLLIALTGTTFAIALFCFFTALEHTTILIANLFSNTHPLWVGLIEALVLKALLDRRVWLGLLLALGGGALFSLSGLAGGADMGANPPLGMLFALGAA